MERAITFKNGDNTLRGILHVPQSSANNTGVIFLHGWSGCRLGPHRMFVKTARTFCDMGCYCLRFDFVGRGESDGTAYAASISSMISDARSAIQYLTKEARIERLILLGICSGGKVAIGAGADHSQVDGLILWSAEPMGRLRTSTSTARKSLFAARNYLKKLVSRDTWRRIALGRVNTGLVSKAMFGHERPSRQELKDESLILKRFESFKGEILFIYGSNDPDTKEAANSYARFCREVHIENQFHEIEGANHSFYSLDWERRVVALSKEWIDA